MEINKLSELEAKKAKPGKKEHRLSDGSGLYLVVKPNGGKLWRRSYEFNGKEKLLSYGPYPAVTLAKAWEEHEKARTLKRQGIDPAAEKQVSKRAEEEQEQASLMPTFAALTEEWLNTWSKKKSGRYVETVKTRLNRDILPAVGNVPIDRLKAAVLVKIVSGIHLLIHKAQLLNPENRVCPCVARQRFGGCQLTEAGPCLSVRCRWCGGFP